MASKKQVKRFMIRELENADGSELWDGSGCVNYTLLAESAAWHFKHDEWLDDETHWVWDLAVDVADMFPGAEPEERSGTGLSNCRSPFGYGVF